MKSHLRPYVDFIGQKALVRIHKNAIPIVILKAIRESKLEQCTKMDTRNNTYFPKTYIFIH